MCGHTRRDQVRNDNIPDSVGVAPIAKKLVQYHLRWFKHIQRRPPDASVHSGWLKHTDNVKTDRGGPNLTWRVRKERSKELECWDSKKKTIFSLHP
jgi:hypothetical protein